MSSTNTSTSNVTGNTGPSTSNKSKGSRIFIGVCLIILFCVKFFGVSNDSERWKTPRFWWEAVQKSEVVSPNTKYGIYTDDMQFWTLYIPDSSTSSDFETAAQFVLKNFSSDPNEPAYAERYSIRTDSCLDTSSRGRCKALAFYNENLNSETVAAGVAAIKNFESPLWTDDGVDVLFTAATANAEDQERLFYSGSLVVRTSEAADVSLWNDASVFARDSLPGYSIEILSDNVMVGYTTDFLSAEQLKSSDLTSTISARNVVAGQLNLNGCHVNLSSGESKIIVLCDPGKSEAILPGLQRNDERLKAIRDAVNAEYPGVVFQFVADPVDGVGVPTYLDTRF